MKIPLTIPLFTAFIAMNASPAAKGDPLLTNWSTERSGQYARIYLSKADALTGNAVSTWSTQTLPAYSDIQKIEYSNDWVYVSTRGLASHLMGPWYFDDAKTRLFDNLPTNQNILNRFPRIPVVATSKTTNQLGGLGSWANGVGLYNMLDGAFYANGAESQDGGQGVQTAYWIRNAMFVEVVTFDNTNGHQPPSGDYHYHADPKALRYQLNDNVKFTPASGADNAGVYSEDTSKLKHSPILGWAYDGYPVYGPYGYADPDTVSSNTNIRRITSGFVPRDGNFGTIDLAKTGRNTLAKWSAEMRSLTTTSTTYAITNTNQRGPAVDSTYVIGYWVEDFAYLGDLGYTQGVEFDLDVHNGRFCRTPEFPAGTYAYFVTIDGNDSPAFPYAIGRQYYGEVMGGAVTSVAEETTVVVEAGPNLEPEAQSISADPDSNEITIIWDGAEGGLYRVDTSPDLSTWDETGAVTTAASTEIITTGRPYAEQVFYRMTRTGLSPYDDTEFGTITGGGPGGNPGGGGDVAGTGNPIDGFAFAFTAGPPMANLVSNVKVGNVSGTIVNYSVNGPTGGTVTISFNDSGFVPGTTYTASFSHTPPQSGALTAVSTNTYSKP